MTIDQLRWARAIGWSSLPDNQGLGDRAQVVFVFGKTEQLQASQGFEQLRKSYPKACIFGCSTGGAIQDTRVFDDDIVATALSFEHTTVLPAREPVTDFSDSFAAGRRLVRQLAPKGLRHLFVLADGLKVNGSDLVDGILSVLPAGTTISGGFAADGGLHSKTHVWCDGEPEESAVIAIGFYGDRLKVGVCATGGWGTFGPDRLITKSKKNVLYEFDGRPALEVYKRYLGEHAAGLPATGLMFPLNMRVGNREDRVLRSLLAIDETAQSITFAGNMPEGAYARLMMGHVDELVDGTQHAARSSVRELNGHTPPFSLLVSCSARRSVLKQRVEEEVEIIREVLSGDTVFTGFYSYGEIAPPEGGGTAILHNETMVVITFAES